MMFKKCFFVLNLLLLGLFLFACEKKVASNSSIKETRTLSDDILVKEKDKQKNDSSRKQEIANIIFKVPQYYSQEKTGVEYRGLALDASFFEKDSANFIGFHFIDSTNTELVKSNKEDLIKAFGEEYMDVVIKTEESMVDNNYILRIMGSKDKSTLAVALLVNDSANKGVIVFLATYESEKYSDFSKMIDNAKFKVDDLELVGGVKGTTTRSDEYGVYTYISGIVRNNTDKKYSYIQITFALFDKDGNKVGTAMANENNISAGETWKFKAIALEDFSTYKLDEITGW